MGYTARWACLAFRLAPTLPGPKYLSNDLYNTHGLPLCQFLLAAQFADVIEGACRLPPLRPLLCNYQTIYKTWQAHKEARQRPGAWHLNSARGLAIWRAGCKGGWGLNPDFPFLVEYKRLCNSTLWWNNIYFPASLTLLLICVMWHRQCRLVLVLPFRRCPKQKLFGEYNPFLWTVSGLNWTQNEPTSQKQCQKRDWINLSKGEKPSKNVMMQFWEMSFNSPLNIFPTYSL